MASERLHELSARQAIRDLRHQYCHRVDAREYDAWARLFAPDAVLDIEGRDPYRGRDEIRAFGTDVLDAEYAHAAHLVCNPLVAVDGDRAEGRWYLYFRYERRDGTAGWRQGSYDETYRRADDGWLFDRVTAGFDAGVERSAANGTTVDDESQ